MSANPAADLFVNRFVGELALAGASDGWSVVRTIAGNADRQFELRRGGIVIQFSLHISLSSKGFWGLTKQHAAAMLAGRVEHLVLLRDGGTGFFVPNPILQRLMGQFSVAESTGAVKINENRVRAQARFSDAEELFDLLKARVPAESS